MKGSTLEQELEYNKYTKILRDCTIGHAKLQLVEKPYFEKPLKDTIDMGRAKINDREINAARTAGMVDSLDRLGFLRMDRNVVIIMVVNKSWFSTELLKDIEGASNEDVPFLKLTKEGIQAMKDGKWNPVEGLGRRSGAEAYVEQRDRLRTMVLEKIQKLQSVPHPENNAGQIEELQKMVARLEAEAENASWWTFRLIDEGKLF